MLLYDVVKHAFTKDRHDPLDCDMVVLDEVSMLDLALSDSTMDAIPTGCSVVLVGDPNQLPSVGAGRVLDDIIQSGRVPVTRLTEIFRQAQKSLIINNANKVLGGMVSEALLEFRDVTRIYVTTTANPYDTKAFETVRSLRTLMTSEAASFGPGATADQRLEMLEKLLSNAFPEELAASESVAITESRPVSTTAIRSLAAQATYSRVPPAPSTIADG